MRILITTVSGGFVGGIETYIQAVVPYLRELGHEVGVMCQVAPEPEIVRRLMSSAGIECWSTPISLRQIEDWRPDVVYSQGLSDAELESQITKRFPTVLYAHAYHGTCISGTKCFAHRNFEPCRRRLGPMCLAYYFPFGCGGRNPLTMLAFYRQQRRRLKTLRRYQAILVADRHMETEYQRHGVAEDRLQLLKLFPTGVVPDPAPPSARARTDRVLFVGRVVALKGVLHLAEAVALAGKALGRRLTLVVAGEGSELEPLRQSAQRHEVPVEILGTVDSERRTLEMRRADLLLVPSLWPEPFGLVGIEAGCVGLPTAGYRNGGIADWLLPGETGEAPLPGLACPQALAAAVTRALQDDEHWNSLRRGAWKLSQEYRAVDHANRLTEILRQAAQNLGRDQT